MGSFPRFTETVTVSGNVAQRAPTVLLRFSGLQTYAGRKWNGFDRYSPVGGSIIVSMISISRKASSIARSASGSVTVCPCP